MGFDQERIGEALPPDGEVVCFSALARVVDTEKDPIHVLQDGDANGITVTCEILTGPFAGAEVVALCASPLGSWKWSPIAPGARVLLQLVDGHLDGVVVATHVVPGGKENPIPKAVAGIAVDEKGLAANEVVAPPKRTGLRFYMRAGMFIVRLKGKQDDFASAFAVECDDGAFFRCVWNSGVGAYAFKVKDAKGAWLSIVDGAVQAATPNGKNGFILSDEGATFNVDIFRVAASSAIVLDGLILENMPGDAPLTTPTNAAIYGPGGTAGACTGVPSVKHFIGG